MDGLDKYSYKEYNENNVMIKYIRIDESGYRCDEYDDNDTPTKFSWSNSSADGEEYYDEDGNRTMRKTWYHDTEVDGDIIYSERTYWSNGNDKSYKGIHVDGRTLIETYDESGNCISSENKFPPDYVIVDGKVVSE